ncbi:MAG: hypothetical protein IJP90_11630 [Treponema sp.]|nr:hypothetical protein [Treponema sp.]
MEKETKKLNYNDLEESKELVLRFRNEFLHGNIDELANFSFWTIAGNPSYDGTCTPNSLGKFDGDKTRIVYAIDRLLYSDLCKNFILGKDITGDTINTFRTLLGNRFSFWGNKEIEVEENFNFSSKLKQYRNDFFFTYQTIGNFYLLPCKTVKRQSINTFRGDNKRPTAWFDYFDLFLNNLKERLPLKEISNKNDDFQILLNENRHFFNIEMDFKKFIDIFYLKDYFENSNIVSYNHITNKIAHWWTNELTEYEYKKFAFGYIAKATELINKRSIKLVEVLKKNIQN